ncbi:hypothetical protein [Lacimicrobium alkaliphilum]|uniref:MFS transporter permease n=1 Tax=Lacimicrobium alkaliphilum TaxID=1526571 RepID=A0A0U3AKC2_9ALTE|nr:hypothetical protein [Lacimicrobium alkaliphilum]ALS99201.1 hypothetical protein AT746_13670 [Lacimicrobium alkaliphilum]
MQDYSLHDLVLFSAEVFKHLQRAYNSNLWPWHWLALLGGGLLFLSLKYNKFTWLGPWYGAISWWWLAWGYAFQHYGQINWAADYLAWFFALQGLLMLLLLFRKPERAINVLVILLLVYAFMLRPLWQLLMMEPAMVSLPGLFPLPSLLVTLAILGHYRAPLPLWLLPLLLLLLETMTLWLLGLSGWTEGPIILLIMAVAILAKGWIPK